MRDLSTLTIPELKAFFRSFDQIVSDMDGVLWNVVHNIPGAPAAIASLQLLGKQIVAVSNNTTKSLDTYDKQLQEGHFNIERSSVVTPIPVIISYLHKRNFPIKKLFVLGSTTLKDALKAEGFSLAKNAPRSIEETILEFMLQSSIDDDPVAAVVVDVDLNLNYLNLQKATNYLLDPKVEFICGGRDVTNTTGKSVLLGPGNFIKILEDATGRKATGTGKRSQYLNEYLMERFKIGRDPSRVLLIGDSVAEDMVFAAQSGYKKLLVLSGMTKRSDVEEWSFPGVFKPDFYVENLKTVHELIQRVFGDEF